MSLATTAESTLTIDAPAEVVYDLIADVTQMGRWSPECVRCEWVDEPGLVGSTFRGHNRSSIARWTTTARVQVADRPRTFSFATLYRDEPSTVWTYRLEGDGPTQVTESFEAITAPVDPIRRDLPHPQPPGAARSGHGENARRAQDRGRGGTPPVSIRDMTVSGT
jgi:hypothetical protein